jgi:Protein of unknown function (DUF2384)
MSRARVQPESAVSEALVVTKATLRAAEKLGLTNKVLGNVIGLSEPMISRMRKGDRVVARGQKQFELAVLFVRLYRSLDSIVGGDDAVAGSWLRNRNTVLNAVPIELIQTVPGLMNVIQYLDSRRAVV